MSIKQIGEIKELQLTVESLLKRVQWLEDELKRRKGGRPSKEKTNGKRAETLQD